MIDDLDAVRAVGASDPDADLDTRARIRARVLEPEPRPSRLLRVVGAALSTGALATVAVAYVVVVGSNEDAADRSADTPPPVAAPAVERSSLFPAPGEFLYVRSIGAYRSCTQDRDGFTCELGPQREREVWVSPSDPGRLRQSGTAPSTKLGTAPLMVGNRRFTRAELVAYRPTGADLLRDLQKGRVPGQGGETASYPYVQITDVLREGIAPPALRAALIDALRLTPGVRGLGPARDRRGRRGLAFARIRDGLQEWVLVDPISSTLLEERETVVSTAGDAAREISNAEVGDQVGGAVYLERAIVNSSRERP